MRFELVFSSVNVIDDTDDKANDYFSNSHQPHRQCHQQHYFGVTENKEENSLISAV